MSVACVTKCGRLRGTRGLCPTCYSKAYLRVKAGETTWEQLEAEGNAVPPLTKVEKSKRFSASLRRLSNKGKWEG